MQGPTPKTDREYLIQIYGELRAVRERDLPELAVEIRNHCGRIDQLESWRQRVNGGLKLSAIVGTVLAGVGAAIGIVKSLWQ